MQQTLFAGIDGNWDVKAGVDVWLAISLCTVCTHTGHSLTGLKEQARPALRPLCPQNWAHYSPNIDNAPK